MDNMYMLGTNGELYHWGIKGMKWGVRRYQNKDGSLTPAGKKRYNEEVAALKEREKSIKTREREKAQRAKLDAKKAELDEREKALSGVKKSKKSGKDDAKDNAISDKSKQKSVKDMSDEELAQAINRARMEDAYRQLRPDPQPKPGFMNRMINDVVAPAVMESGKTFVKDAISKAGKELLKDKADPNSLEALKKTYDKLKVQSDIEKLKSGDNLNWENMKKKLEYERMKNGDADNSQSSKNPKEETNTKDSGNSKNSKKTKDTSDSKTESKSKSDTKSDKQRDDEPEVFGTGKSKAERFNRDTEWWKNPYDYTDYVDIDDVPAYTTSRGRDYIQNVLLLEEPKRGGG